MKKLVIACGLASLVALGCQPGPTAAEKAQMEATQKAQMEAAKAMEASAKMMNDAITRQEEESKAEAAKVKAATDHLNEALKGVADTIKSETEAAKQP
jgi:hypothetical protein